MTKILILGGGGMIGQKLAARLRETGLAGEAAPEIDLFDIAFPPTSAPHGQEVGSLTDTEALHRLAARRYDVIFHLASIVSGQAEQDFEAGWHINMLPMWTFLDALRGEHMASNGAYRPRLVFTSSVAVFGGPYPDAIDDAFLTAPQTSYGAQKACCEVMLSDVSRKGFVDGISLRLPTICVRPGAPNAAASGFYSGIIREPLNGQRATLPVPDTLRHWFASPRSAVGFLVHAAELDLTLLEGRRALNMPGVSCTVAEQITALRRVAGQQAVNLIEARPDPDIAQIVSGWPRDFRPERAQHLGFKAETSFDEIIEVYLSDDFRASAPV